jgi:Ca-activated chloride channel homolog
MRYPRLALACLAGLVGVLSAQPAAHQQGVAFRSTTEAVPVDVFVTRANKPVEGLRAEDFEVRDSGVRQRVELVSLESMPVDLLIALDASISVSGKRLEHLKDAAHAAVAALRPMDRALLLTFSNDIKVDADWTSDRQQLSRAIDALTASGWTSLVDAAFTALTMPETPGHRPLLLLFTDGLDTSSWLSAADVLKTAEQARMTVYGVSAGTTAPRRITVTRSSDGSMRTGEVDLDTELSNAPAPLLRERLVFDPIGFRSFLLPVLVNDMGGELLHASDADLRPTFVDILARFNRRYLLSYQPVGVPRAGWHPIEVRLKDASMKVTARRGYSR